MRRIAGRLDDRYRITGSRRNPGLTGGQHNVLHFPSLTERDATGNAVRNDACRGLGSLRIFTFAGERSVTGAARKDRQTGCKDQDFFHNHND